MSLPPIEQRISQLAQALGLAEIPHAGGSWALEISGFVIVAQLDESASLLTARLPPWPDGDEPARHRQMLQASFASPEMDATFALDEEDHPLLLGRVTAYELESVDLAPIVERFVALGEMWSRQLAKLGEPVEKTFVRP